MSIKEIQHAIYEERVKNEGLETPGNCRYATSTLLEIARTADLSAPKSHTRILVYPQATQSEYVHYCLEIGNETEGTFIINTVPAAGFPQYLGPKKDAPGFFPQMIETDSVV